ncbi:MULTISPECIES: molybdopterin molybdotransferase MoeA [Bradyrhizobium]|uniref:molybdopterin molybdotransferase MoeA n=1 Tax=Bradyrhizobium TaxID=374 RepID=UPI00067EF3B0|nr:MULTISPECIES: gephyrin-like molybdotransferase Glp [Bradyrhizobium]PAY04664.1 molybdopterin molybdenumtransferase MoeA [Bradyrhizobium sp. UFLA03-84]
MPSLLQTQHDACLAPAKGGIVSVRDALATGLAEAQPIVETELVDLSAVAGRVLAEPIKADDPLPRFDTSAMDGYAVDTASLPEFVPIRLKVTGSIAAGRTVGSPVLRKGGAFRILTGAPIPAGANAVIAQEEVCRDGNSIIFTRVPRPGDNIRRRGEDVGLGHSLIEAGTVMGPLQVGVAAACGYPGVRVLRRLRVAMFTTGSELRQPGENIQPGEIYDANRFILRGLLAKPWIDIIDLGSCIDRPSSLRAVFQTAAARADVILSAGGVSVGDEDHVVDAFQLCGGRLWVRKVAIKPGKPLVLGKIADATYVGLPGNPGALFTTFKIMIEQILGARAGIKSGCAVERAAIANFDWRGQPGRTTYLPAVQRGDADGFPLIELLPGANSGRLHQLSCATGFVVIAPESEAVARGDKIRWRPLEGHA